MADVSKGGKLTPAEREDLLNGKGVQLPPLGLTDAELDYVLHGDLPEMVKQFVTEKLAREAAGTDHVGVRNDEDEEP